MKKISLVLIEDNRLLRESILRIIAKQEDLRVKASFKDCDSALNRIGELKPDIILSDLDISNNTSLEFVKKLKKDLADIKIIVMDVFPVVEGVLFLVEAGVSGFILKDAKSSEILKTIRSVSKGEKILPSTLTESLFSQIVDKALSDSISPAIIETIKMTNRERQIMELVSQGFANKEIAEELNLSIFTVKSHIHNLLEKLAFNTRVQIANYAHNTKKNKAVENET